MYDWWLSCLQKRKVLVALPLPHLAPSKRCSSSNIWEWLSSKTKQKERNRTEKKGWLKKNGSVRKRETKSKREAGGYQREIDRGTDQDREGIIERSVESEREWEKEKMRKENERHGFYTHLPPSKWCSSSNIYCKCWCLFFEMQHMTLW